MGAGAIIGDCDGTSVGRLRHRGRHSSVRLLSTIFQKTTKIKPTNTQINDTGYHFNIGNILILVKSKLNLYREYKAAIRIKNIDIFIISMKSFFFIIFFS